MRRRPERLRLAAIAVVAGVALSTTTASSQKSASGPIRIVLGSQPADALEQYGKFEAEFAIENAGAAMMHWPYDTNTPAGIPAGQGITVNGEFTNPKGATFSQPAFYYQRFRDEVRNGRDWHYPTGEFVWKLRFTPNESGTWKYRVVAASRAGSAASEWRTITVKPSSRRGFIRVSRADSRYFEFEDGTFFSGLGFQFPEFLDDPTTKGGPAYARLGQHGVNFVRLWLSSLFGSAWAPYTGGRNRYAGYLPVTGLTPVRDQATGEATLAMRLDYEPEGDTGWFDACRLQATDDPEAVKPNTQYRVRATYQASGVSGPRQTSSPFGFVVKLGGMFPNCYTAGTSRPVTSYGGDSAQWRTIEGMWNSGNRSFLPKLHLALENARAGEVHVRSLSMREMLPDGTLGPEILTRPSMEYQLYIPQEKAFAFDKIVRLAERHGVYIKLVVMEKADKIYLKTEDDGRFVSGKDNPNGFYGTGRVVNKTRWLQQAWWRYLQARWGYSPSIHSWELVNEGDPALVRHYELADEFGKFMHYGAFGAKPGAGFDHPNDHLVTTSFWHSFPTAFWGSAQYPNVDYADIHAYVSTTFAPGAEKKQMLADSAYYHEWHSRAAGAAKLGKPVVRGEAGLDLPGRQDEFALGLHQTRDGAWLHNFLWSGLHAGGLYELYWWRSHIWSQQRDHRPKYRLIGEFLSDLELNKGGYTDWGGRTSDAALRVVGQKNVASGRMHLWIRNAAYTWRNAASGQPIAAGGEITAGGFKPRARYRVEWWDTHAPVKTTETEEVAATAGGELTISVKPIARDIALKVRPMTAQGEIK